MLMEHRLLIRRNVKCNHCSISLRENLTEDPELHRSKAGKAIECNDSAVEKV